MAKPTYKVCEGCAHPKSNHVWRKGYPITICWVKGCRCKNYREVLTSVKPRGKRDVWAEALQNTTSVA